MFTLNKVLFIKVLCTHELLVKLIFICMKCKYEEIFHLNIYNTK